MNLSLNSLLLLTILMTSNSAHSQTPSSVQDPIPEAQLRGSLPTEKFGEFNGTFDCEKFRTKNIGCDPATVVRNCKSLEDKIPNKAALDYTLEYFFENHGELQDPSCALASDIMDTDLIPETSVRQGINSPRFILRDMGTAKASKVDSYLVDLCSGDFKKFKSNIGTGTSRDGKGLADVDEKHTSLAGAFLTDDKTTRLVPSHPEDYKAIMKNYGDKTRIYLVGLNSSNNSTVLSKPMHISPYNSSWGCPSVTPEDADVMTRFVKDGQRSLLMTYDKDSMQKLGDGASCKNGEGRGDFKITDGRPRASGTKKSGHRRSKGRK